MKTILARPFLVLFVLSNCAEKPDFEAEKQKLLQLHADQQKAHLEENMEQFVSQGAENMISINRGKISTPSREN